MITALYGGSFNPPTNAHLTIARQVRSLLSADEVWLMVSPQNPLKEAAELFPFHHRLAMTELLVRDEVGLCASDIENQIGTRATADTLRKLFKQFPTRRFIWVMGADNLATLHKWEGWHFIMDHVPMLVLPRPGYNAAALASPAAQYDGVSQIDDPAALATSNGWCLLPGEGNAISATAEREAIRQGLPTPNLSPTIRNYITTHQLKP